MQARETCRTGQQSAESAHVKSTEAPPDPSLEREALRSRMSRIAHKIMVLSGKGGVGKSTVAVNLATALALTGRRVGLLDIDIHGPSVPKLLHLERCPILPGQAALQPVATSRGAGVLTVMSIGFLLRERDDAVIWRGPMKHAVIKQFLKDVEWGDLDFLVIDSPPGTGDEPLTVAQLVERPDGAVVVTTPQEVAVQDVRRCINFCRKLKLPVLGVIENMSGLACPRCGMAIDVFGAGGGRAMAQEMGAPFLGAIPIDPAVAASGENGAPIVEAQPDSGSATEFTKVAQMLIAADGPGGCPARGADVHER
jgi:ATP-binding protein involved in chromosome partitioning